MVPMVRLILILDRLAVRSGTMSLTSPVRVPQCLGPDVLAPLHLHPGCEDPQTPGTKTPRIQGPQQPSDPESKANPCLRNHHKNICKTSVTHPCCSRSLPMASAVAKTASRRICVYVIAQMTVAIAFENQRRTDRPPMLNAWK